MLLNDPAVVAELMRLHSAYEQALVTNDVAALDSMFWDSPHAVRYGVTENLHGADEIRAFRKSRPNLNLIRSVPRLEIMSFGDSSGIINLEFIRLIDGVERAGRQTQFWSRLPEGWRIVSAHVSLLPPPDPYLNAAARRIGLPVAATNRAAVSQDLARIGQIAEFLMEFPLPQDTESAPVFRP